jgi:heme-degrading monooxygenase HmoA
MKNIRVTGKEAKMIITILEGQVPRQRAAELERSFQETESDLPSQIVESFLVRDAEQGTRYQIITVWQSRAALEDYRASVEKPKGVEMFEAAGSPPELSRLQVIVRVAHPASTT